MTDDDYVSDLLKKRILIRQNRLILFSSIGAILGKDEEGYLFLKYWRKLNSRKGYSQVRVRKPITYFSGFCSQHRGLRSWKG